MAQESKPHESKTTNWKLTLAYDGTALHGWQVQPGKDTVQLALSDAIAAVSGERVLPQGAGRTDAGVHAAGQVASFSLAAPIPADRFPGALNRVLPRSIRVLAADKAAPDFHARYSAFGKIYRYRIFHGRVCSPFLAPYVTGSRWPLDFEAMQQAAQVILGEHDFTSFAASDPDRAARVADEAGAGGSSMAAHGTDSATPRSAIRGNVRRIDESHWSCVPVCIPLAALIDFQVGMDLESSDSPEEATTGQIFTYTICGNGFLHHMVRNLVGTFLEAGRGRIAAGDIPGILDGRNRALAGPTAPANGLCLMKVLY